MILLYHRIVKDASTELIDYSPSGMTVGVSAFDEQMAYTRANYDVVPLAELVGRLVAGRPLGDNVCAVTFDDGWRDNFTDALPVLQRYGLPATIFLTCSFIGGGPWFWEERLKYLLAHLVQRRSFAGTTADDRAEIDRALESIGLGGLTALPTARVPDRLTMAVTLRRGQTREAHAEMLGRLERLLDRPGLIEPRRFMNWAEVAAMRAQGVTFGAHTMTHLNLQLSSPAECEAEVFGCKAVLEQHLGSPTTTFAYPFGRHTEAVRETVQRAGFVAAVTSQTGFISNRSDPTLLNRVDISDKTAPCLEEFACRILGLMGH